MFERFRALRVALTHVDPDDPGVGLRSSVRLQVLVGISLVAAITSLGLHQLVINDQPEAFDQSNYLQEAVRIKDYGGIGSFPSMLLEGEFRQGNQHPLYILAIPPFASFDISFLITAKFVSLFFAVASIFIGYVLLLRLHGPLVAALAALGFALTHVYIQWGTLASESLMVLLSTIGAYGILRGFSDARPVDRVWDSADVPKYRADLLQWLRLNVGDGDRYVEGPLFAWQLEHGAHLTPAQSARENPESFERFMRTYNVKYVVVDWDSMNSLRYRGAESERTGWADRREKLKGIVSFDETLGIVEHELPEGWTRVAADQKGRVEFVVYQIG